MGEIFTANPGKSIDKVSNSYIKLIEDQSPWPEGFVPQQRVLKSWGYIPKIGGYDYHEGKSSKRSGIMFKM
ncbi:MAG TPA: hypothetical protein DDW50_05695 [Firmicutes bacterium]|nr:hypothetical protein [Bacillota bacterium]